MRYALCIHQLLITTSQNGRGDLFTWQMNNIQNDHLREHRAYTSVCIYSKQISNSLKMLAYE